MALQDFIKNLFQPAIEADPKYEKIREKNTFFLNHEQHEHYKRYGYCVIPNVINQEEINDFMSTFDAISKLEGFELDKHLLNSGRLFNPEIRKKTQDVINKNAAHILPRMFNMDVVDEHTGGAYQVKPAHPNSDLQIHQDSTVIDEENEYCLFVWIPFCDVDEENGPIWVLPGSHLWGNTQRSLGVPWNFLKHLETMKEYMYPVPVKKGDVMVFDPAMIHSSAPNYSKEIRHAITITVLKKDYQLVYYFKNKEISEDKIEKYYVDENFYYGYDFKSKPDEEKWKKEVVDYKPFDLSKKELIKLIKSHSPS